MRAWTAQGCAKRTRQIRNTWFFMACGPALDSRSPKIFLWDATPLLLCWGKGVDGWDLYFARRPGLLHRPRIWLRLRVGLSDEIQPILCITSPLDMSKGSLLNVSQMRTRQGVHGGRYSHVGNKAKREGIAVFDRSRALYFVAQSLRNVLKARCSAVVRTHLICLR